MDSGFNCAHFDTPSAHPWGPGNWLRITPSTLASGGKSCTGDRISSAVLAASIFHFGEYTIAEAKRYMDEHNIQVRETA